MQKLKRVVGTIESMNTHWGVFVGYFVFAIMFIILFEIVSRIVFAPTFWAYHLTQLIFGGLIVMGGAYTLLHGGHIRMDLIYNRLPSDRVRAIVDVVASGFFFLFCGILLYYSAIFSWEATLTDRRIHAWTWDARAWPTLWTVPVAIVLLMTLGLIKLARDLRVAISGRRQT